jgi:xanthine dehydrogenase accessory factor
LSTEPYVEATVVHVVRPASARPGDRARIDARGRIHGFVGGECAEESVRLHALRVLETGAPLLLRIVGTAGSGEAGGVGDVDVEEGCLSVANPCLSGGGLEIFLEPHLPAPRLVVAGDTPIANALRELAAGAGYEIVPADGGVRSDDVAVVVASHGRDEEGVLAAALEAGVPYVGLVASRRRGPAVLAALGEDAARVRTPAGLDIGAVTPAEIAVSILAEVVAVRRAHRAEATDPVGAAGPVTATDPVCGMEVAPTDATPYLDVDGERVWFCSEHCRGAYSTHGRTG